MSVGKIFKVLIIVVACVIIGALVLNVLLPNTATTMVNAVEDQITNATGLKFDLNGDGDAGNTGSQTYKGDSRANDNGTNSNEAAGVNGFN